MINTVIDESKVETSFVERLQNPARDYAKSASAFMWLGWIGLGVCLIVMILGFSLLNITRPVLAVEDGRVVGTVQYDDRQIRSLDQITLDLKQFVRHYVNQDSETLWEDYAIFSSHLCPEGQARSLAELASQRKAFDEFASQNIRSYVNFDFEKSGVKAVELESYQGDQFRAIVRAERIVGLDVQEVKRFQYRLQGRFVQRTEQRPLGLEVCGTELMKWGNS